MTTPDYHGAEIVRAEPNGALRSERLTRCYECGRPFSHPVSEARAKAEWGDAADDEIAYVCGACAAPEDLDAD